MTYKIQMKIFGLVALVAIAISCFETTETETIIVQPHHHHQLH